MPTNDPPPSFTTWMDNVTVSNSTDPQWNRNIFTDSSSWNGPIETKISRILLKDLDLHAYSEVELRDFQERLDGYLRSEYPPKPPKFASIEEADAWMEEHYGQ